jgi:hypothetical protein
MPDSYSAPTRALPAKPSLAQLRKQAKELLKAFLAGHSAAVLEVERFEQFPDRTRFALADAQRVLARSYGFSSWTKLKQHVDGVNVKAFCEAVDAGDVVSVRKLAKARPELVSLSPDGENGERIPLENSEKGPTRFDETVRLLRARGAKLTPRAAVAIGDGESVRQMHREGRLDNEIHSLRGGLLSIAVRVNRPEMVSLLLDLGLVPGGGGYTILHHLASDYADEQTRVIRATMLLDAGASLKRRDPLLKSTSGHY